MNFTAVSHLPDLPVLGLSSFLSPPHRFRLNSLPLFPQYVPGGDLHDLVGRCPTEPGLEREAKAGVPARCGDPPGRFGGIVSAKVDHQSGVWCFRHVPVL